MAGAMNFATAIIMVDVTRDTLDYSTRIIKYISASWEASLKRQPLLSPLSSFSTPGSSNRSISSRPAVSTDTTSLMQKVIFGGVALVLVYTWAPRSNRMLRHLIKVFVWWKQLCRALFQASSSCGRAVVRALSSASPAEASSATRIHRL